MGRFFNRDTSSSTSGSSQDAADYAAAQDQRDLQSNRDDTYGGHDQQPADGTYTEAGRWAL